MEGGFLLKFKYWECFSVIWTLFVPVLFLCRAILWILTFLNVFVIYFRHWKAKLVISKHSFSPWPRKVARTEGSRPFRREPMIFVSVAPTWTTACGRRSRSATNVCVWPAISVKRPPLSILSFTNSAQRRWTQPAPFPVPTWQCWKNRWKAIR